MVLARTMCNMPPCLSPKLWHLHKPSHCEHLCAHINWPLPQTNTSFV
jgi:hypothetical protein